MAYIRTYLNNVLMDQVEFTQGQLSIGRDPDNDIILDNAGVSAHHAVIEKKEHAFEISDNDSTNGVFVNGERITRHTLKYWDEVQIYNYVLKFMAVAGLEGLSKFKGKKHDILSMAIMYPNLLQVVTLKKSGITNIEQIKGRKISSGSPGSGTNFMAETVFKALGIPLDSYSDSRLSFTESANALRDGTIEVGVWSVGPGTSSILDLATTHDIHIISFTSAQQKKILAANKEYSAVDLAGGVYRGVDKPVPTIGVWNVMICQRWLETDLVYKLVKALYERQDYLLKIHPSASYTTPENAVKYSPIPLHKGTLKYLEEKGISVPPRLLP